MDKPEDNKNEVKRKKDQCPSPEIKSTAVMKYTAFQDPVRYAQLQCNTDLSLPPSNWGGAIDSCGLKQIVPTGSGLSSFRMAHMFPDCVGEVDFISGAECLKKLLKLPYQPSGTVSMMVHRVENALLLDGFHVYDYLMKSEWSWLKEFFYENIIKTLSEQGRLNMTVSGAGPGRQLTFKFLSHSAPPPPPRAAVTPARSACLTGPFLPEPETITEEPTQEHQYQRNFLWTFEDIHMLIGSDLPIFGDKDRPCVSLRLRDAREPINVLTGIDYWLDNMMCNVPEVLMCYHCDGIVQKYEPIKTEDLPNLEHSKFSPKVMRNVAKNILSFLKSKATKFGHTYWLFKRPDEDVVKLYDLTSLCPKILDNPFTTPVAMLLYRVARNVRLTNGKKHVKQMLEHVLKLLKEETYPQIVASSYYMLADLYVPATLIPARPVFEDEICDPDDEEVEFTAFICATSDGITAEDDSSEDGDEATNVIVDEENNVKVVSENTQTNVNSDFNMNGSEDNNANCNKTMDDVTEHKEQSHDDKTVAIQTSGLLLRNIGDQLSSTNDDNHALTGNTKDTTAKIGISKSMGATFPDRVRSALSHALGGIQALRHIALDACRIANSSEPNKMPNSHTSDKKKQEHSSRNRKKKKNKKKKEKASNNAVKSDKMKSDIETSPSPEQIENNAILIRKEQNTFPSWHEPHKDDNFAWKLHLKILLYEKICLSYATLAEYSYITKQYGHSLKYFDIASKCQNLLNSMIVKSKIIDASVMIGKVGDTYFQLSNHWHRVKIYKQQFLMEHEIDVKIKQEIANDMMIEEVEKVKSDEFDLNISLPNSDIKVMYMTCDCYKRAIALSDEKLPDIMKKLASMYTKIAVIYIHKAQRLVKKYQAQEEHSVSGAKGVYREYGEASRRAESSLDEATGLYREVGDSGNLAMMYCTKGRYLRIRAQAERSVDFCAVKRKLYAEAEKLFLEAQNLTDVDDSFIDLINWEYSCHLYDKAAVMRNSYGDYFNCDVVDALHDVLRHCHCQLGPGPRQARYQQRAAEIHHLIASLYHMQYRGTTEDGHKRRTLMNAICSNYEQAATMYATLQDTHLYLAVIMEHVGLMQSQAAVSPNLILKSHRMAIQMMRQCHSVVQLVKEQDPAAPESSQREESDHDSQEYIHTLLCDYVDRLHHHLKSIVQHYRSKTTDDNMTDVYKKLYCASLRIKKSEDIKEFAASICDALESMLDIDRDQV